MKKRITALLAIVLSAGVALADSTDLIEAESFECTGGWVNDQQFMDQMGSAFLLAHGLGKPVKDAVTTAVFSESGEYRVWVRTRDWVAPWKAPDTPADKRASGTPGRFEVLIDGKALPVTFGAENADWHWQDGGTIAIKKDDVQVALHDLTGFDGRCDAILFSKDADLVPPNAGEAMARFRRQLLEHPETVPTAGDYDLVVVGGGVAGACAAVKAARLGVRVALIQDRPMVGGNNSSEVRMWLSGCARTDRAKYLGDILAEFEHDRNALNGNPASKDVYNDDQRNGIILEEDNIEFFPSFRMNQVEMKGDRIVSVTAQSTIDGRRLRFAGDLFADCTGDGCVGVLAGADYEISIEDEGHMGRSNLWFPNDTGEPVSFPRCSWALDLSDKPFPGRSSAKGGAGTRNSGLKALGKWFWESGFCHDPFEKSEYIRDWNLRAMFGAWDALKNVEKAYPNHAIEWAAFISGKRESRRLLGDLILNEEDITKPIWYDDALVPTGWKIDVHYPDPRYNKGFEGDAFISVASFKNCVRPYYIPYRCFYSRNVDNLFMAGRDISVTRAALGAVRVMKTTALMGEVVGMAASLCVQHDVEPRGVYKNHLEELKDLCGVVKGHELPAAGAGPMVILKPGDARRSADGGEKYTFSKIPDSLKYIPCVAVERGDSNKPGKGFTFKISAPATVYIAVLDRGDYTPPAGWKKFHLKLTWMKNLTDTVYCRSFKAGIVEIPSHTGKSGPNYGVPHTAFVQGSGVKITLK